MIQDEFKEEIGLKKHCKRQAGLVQGTGNNEGMEKGEMRKTRTRWEDGFKVVLKWKGQLAGSDPQ